MADREGNVLKVPGTGSVAEVKSDEILGSYARFTQKGLTLKMGSGVLEAGTLLKLSSTAKKYEGATATTDTIVGVLRKAVDTTKSDMLANYVSSGIVKTDKLKYANGTAVAAGDLAAVATALNGRIDTVHNYLVF